MRVKKMDMAHAPPGKRYQTIKRAGIVDKAKQTQKNDLKRFSANPSQDWSEERMRLTLENASYYILEVSMAFW